MKTVKLINIEFIYYILDLISSAKDLSQNIFELSRNFGHRIFGNVFFMFFFIYSWELTNQVYQPREAKMVRGPTFDCADPCLHRWI